MRSDWNANQSGGRGNGNHYFVMKSGGRESCVNFYFGGDKKSIRLICWKLETKVEKVKIGWVCYQQKRRVKSAFGQYQLPLPERKTIQRRWLALLHVIAVSQRKLTENCSLTSEFVSLIPLKAQLHIQYQSPDWINSSHSLNQCPDIQVQSVSALNKMSQS